MARRLENFPAPGGGRAPHRYPWSEWTDGSAWEIRRGDDYEVATENMRVNLHLKAKSLQRKVRTTKTSGPAGEGLVFQFLPSEDEESYNMAVMADPQAADDALRQLHEDALEIYERARAEVTIPRKDGTRQRYAAVRYRDKIERGVEEDALVPAIAGIVQKETTGFGHLEVAERPDLMLENLVLDPSKPYHPFFSATTRQIAQKRMDDYYRRHPPKTAE